MALSGCGCFLLDFRLFLVKLYLAVCPPPGGWQQGVLSQLSLQAFNLVRLKRSAGFSSSHRIQSGQCVQEPVHGPVGALKPLGRCASIPRYGRGARPQSQGLRGSRPGCFRASRWGAKRDRSLGRQYVAKRVGIASQHGIIESSLLTHFGAGSAREERSL